MTLDPNIAARLKRNAEGLFTAVVQERGSGDVLMVAWMDDEALARTLETREATYYSRSRSEQWVKGATSGSSQHVHSVRLDCDGDTVLLTVDQVGGACHTGDHSCFDADLLAEMANQFGSQCIVLSVDARTVPVGSAPTPSGWEVTTHGGRRGTGFDAVEWAARGAELGVGEILLNSMDADGTKAGFDLPMLRAVRAAVTVPVIASGGAGAVDHFAPAVGAGADAVLAASVFHFRELTIGQVKAAMAAEGITVR